MLGFLELTPRFKKLKRRASLEFCVHLDMSQIELSVLQNGVLGILKFSFFIVLKFFFPSLFALSLAERSKIAITF